MAAYCRRFGLADGWLVYAAGGERSGAIQVIAGPAVAQTAVQLELSFSDIQQQIAQVAHGAVSLTATQP